MRSRRMICLCKISIQDRGGEREGGRNKLIEPNFSSSPFACVLKVILDLFMRSACRKVLRVVHEKAVKIINSSMHLRKISSLKYNDC